MKELETLVFKEWVKTLKEDQRNIEDKWANLVDFLHLPSSKIYLSHLDPIVKHYIKDVCIKQNKINPLNKTESETKTKEIVGERNMPLPILSKGSYANQFNGIPKKSEKLEKMKETVKND